MDIVLGNYKGLKANIPYIAYTEEDVNSQIATLLSGNPVREQKTGPLAMGDTAVIDYEGFKDGVAFEGGKAEKYPLGIGSGSFIPGFEEQLVGMEIGEDRDINLSFLSSIMRRSLQVKRLFSRLSCTRFTMRRKQS